MAGLGIFDPDWAMGLAAQLQAVEAGLGIPTDETQRRLTGSLARLAQRRVSAAAKTEHSERSDKRSDSVAFCRTL